MHRQRSIRTARRRSVVLVLSLALALSVGPLAGCASGEREAASGDHSSVTAATETTRARTTAQGPGAETTGPSGTTTPASREKPEKSRTPSVAEVVVSEIDEHSTRVHLAKLTGVTPARLPGGRVTISERGSVEGRRAAAEYVQGSLEEEGIPTRILEFESSSGPGFNVEGTLRGKEGGKHLWVTAHLDSVSNAGANDNASGVVMLLLVAKALARLDLEHTVHFVAYDLEEVGQIGSSIYVDEVVGGIRARQGDQAIIGNLNGDMVGYEPDRFNAVVSTCDQGGPIGGAIVRASEMLDSPVVLGEYCLERSDHINFWDAGLSAALLTDGTQFDGYPWYHTPTDTMDKVNISYLRSMSRLIAATSALLAVPETAR